MARSRGRTDRDPARSDRPGRIGGSTARVCRTTGATAIAMPGWPEFALWTASIESVRIVSTQSRSSFALWLIVVSPSADRARGQHCRRLSHEPAITLFEAQLGIDFVGAVDCELEFRFESREGNARLSRQRRRLLRGQDALQPRPRARSRREPARTPRRPDRRRCPSEPAAVAPAAERMSQGFFATSWKAHLDEFRQAPSDEAYRAVH